MSDRARDLATRRRIKYSSTHHPLHFVVESANSFTTLVAVYNPGVNRLYNSITKYQTGVHVQLLDVRPLTDKKSAIRLIDSSDILVNDLQSILNSTVSPNAGRPPKAVATPATVPTWSRQYDDALDLLQSELSKRGRKQFKKYEQPERVLIIKRVFRGIDSSIAEALAAFTSLSDVALRYTGWQCSEIPVGTWQETQYRDVLRESDKANGIKREKNTRKTK